MATTSNSFSFHPRSKRPLIHTTLLDLVWTVNQMTDDDRLVVAIVTHLVNSGQARLTGAFKNTRVIIG